MSSEVPMRRSHSICLAAFGLPAAGLVLALAAPAAAQKTWTGTVVGSAPNLGPWNDPANWSPAGVPASGTTTALLFSGGTPTPTQTTTQNIAGPFVLNALTFDAAALAYSIGG